MKLNYNFNTGDSRNVSLLYCKITVYVVIKYTEDKVFDIYFNKAQSQVL